LQQLSLNGYNDSNTSKIVINPTAFYTKKQKRAYNNLLSGMQLAYHYNKKIRFLTLSTSDIQYQQEGYDNNQLNNDFRKLKQRIQRMTVAKLIQQGYLSTDKIRKYYPNLPLLRSFDFEYFKVTTNEGNGVLHIIYKGQYLPYNYLVDNWQDIHNSWELNITLLNSSKKDYQKASSYVITQYLSNQDSTYQRSSQSWSWVVRGYTKTWHKFLQECHLKYCYNPVKRRFYKNSQEVNIFKEWHEYLIELTKPPPPIQNELARWCT
jgi:hypothetical protein